MVQIARAASARRRSARRRRRPTACRTATRPASTAAARPRRAEVSRRPGLPRDADCDKVKCDTVQKKCLPAAHDDGIKNLDETGIDCGGPTATVTRCPTGEACAATSDCGTSRCNAATQVCDPPTPTDGLKNGTETRRRLRRRRADERARCVSTGRQGRHATARAAACSTACLRQEVRRRLVVRPRRQPASTRAARARPARPAPRTRAAASRSCLPDEPTRASTSTRSPSGRFRNFITRSGGNVRALGDRPYVAAQSRRVLSYLPTRTAARSERIRVRGERQNDLSATPIASASAQPHGSHGSCPTSTTTTASGLRQLRRRYVREHVLDGLDATQADFGLRRRRSLARSDLDEKPLNCAMPMMFAAFCAWDGGELAT